MAITRIEKQRRIELYDEKLRQVKQLKYIGTIIGQIRRLNEEVMKRTVAAGRLFNGIKNTCLGNKVVPREVRTECSKKYLMVLGH